MRRVSTSYHIHVMYVCIMCPVHAHTCMLGITTGTVVYMYMFVYMQDVDVKKENRIKELIEGKHQLQQKCVC